MQKKLIQLAVTHPADLTVLAKNNNGVFPYDKVYQMIDGRNSTIASHGTREMPIWGYRFGPVQAYRFKARVLAVIDYLKTVQQNEARRPSTRITLARGKVIRPGLKHG